jgi:universal stress protein E
MSEFRRILLVADHTMHRTAAFERAASLARAAGAGLHIALFEYREAIALAGRIDRNAMLEAQEGILRSRRAWLEQQADALRAQHLQVTTDAVWARPTHEGILQHVIELSADLVVKDVHHESLLKRVLFTPLDWQLLRLCPVPLLLINNVASPEPRKFLAAVDPLHATSSGSPGDFNRQIIQAALELAMQCNAELHLVHAFDGVSAFAASAPAGMDVVPNDLYDTLLKNHEEAFKALADAHGVPAECRHLLFGPAPATIAEFAQTSGADVVILGTVHRGGFERLVMGGTAESILERIHCNVLAIKPDGFRQEVAALLERIESR